MDKPIEILPIKIAIVGNQEMSTWAHRAFLEASMFNDVEVSFIKLGEVVRLAGVGMDVCLPDEPPWSQPMESFWENTGTLKVEKNRSLKDSAHPQPFYRKGSW